jgi:hypothetical protein
MGKHIVVIQCVTHARHSSEGLESLQANLLNPALEGSQPSLIGADFGNFRAIFKVIPALIANLADSEQKEYNIRVQADRALRSFPSLIQPEVATPSALSHSLRPNYPIAILLSHSDIFLGEAQMRVLDKKMSLQDN